MPTTAQRIVVAGAEIAVLADGTVVILPKAAQMLMSAQNAGKGGSGNTTDAGKETPTSIGAGLEPIKIVKGSPESVKAWKATLKAQPVKQPETPEGKYQIKHCGDTEHQIIGGGEKVWADGIDVDAASALDTKFNQNPKSPYVEGAKIKQNVLDMMSDKINDEFARYGAFINSPDSPLTSPTARSE